MTVQPQHALYETRGHDEFVLIFDDNFSHQIIIIEPLFEERNLLRRNVVLLARTLSENGIGCSIPDLPGCGESLLDIDGMLLADWRQAVADATASIEERTGHKPNITAFRGGALLDHQADAASWWRFAPTAGAELLRPFRQLQRLRGQDDAFAGYRPNSSLIAELERSVPVAPHGPARDATVSLSSVPPWRRAEPAEDPDLVKILAGDVIDWIMTCGAA